MEGDQSNIATALAVHDSGTDNAVQAAFCHHAASARASAAAAAAAAAAANLAYDVQCSLASAVHFFGDHESAVLMQVDP